MAQSTIDQDIERIEAQLAKVRTHIDRAEKYAEIEEGGQRGGNRTKFTDINKLYKREEVLELRLDILYRSQA